MWMLIRADIICRLPFLRDILQESRRESLLLHSYRENYIPGLIEIGIDRAVYDRKK